MRHEHSVLWASTAVIAALTACAQLAATSNTTNAPSQSASRASATVGASHTRDVKGTLLIHGGGILDSATAARLLALARGSSAPLLVVPHASASDSTTAAFYKTLFSKFGATNVTVLNLADSARAIEQVRQAAYIFLGGGDQSSLMDSLARTGVPEAIRQRYHQGAVVAGKSAGAAVMSSRMILGGAKADLTTVRGGGTELTDGIGLWPKVIIDQHFVKRQRFTRLLAAVLDQPQLVGVGIDENTAVLVVGDHFEVLGTGTVLVIDARQAIVHRVSIGEVHSATGVTLHVLRQGDQFDLAKP